MAQPLRWGRRYLMVRPDCDRIDRRMRQWEALRDAIVVAGGDVEVLEQRPDLPDMVYAMDLGLAESSGRVMLSHMRDASRRPEALTSEPWFAAQGYAVTRTGADGIGPAFESGDAFPFGDALVVGYGSCTDGDALKYLAAEWDLRVRGLRIVHEGMCHLDRAFCPLDSTHAMVYPAAFDAASRAELERIVPAPIALTDDEALAFSANSIVVGDTVIMPACTLRLQRLLAEIGLRAVVLDLSEFHKGGGSVRCLTNPLDTDLAAAGVPGGDVIVPA